MPRLVRMHWLTILLLLLSSRHAAAQGVVSDTLPSVVITRMYEPTTDMTQRRQCSTSPIPTQGAFSPGTR